MIDVLKSLDEALAEEIRLERELAAVGARKREALVALDLREVDQATGREQNLLVALGSAAERRLRRTFDTARLLGLSQSEATVTRIAERAGNPWRATLLARAEELRAALKEVSRVNGANRALTEQSLDYVKRFFRVLGGVKEEVTYTRRGVETRSEVPKLIIDQVV